MKPLKISFLFYSLFLFVGVYIDLAIGQYILIGSILILLILLSSSVIRKFYILPSVFSFARDVIVFSLLFFFIGVGFKTLLKLEQESTLYDLEQYLDTNKYVRMDVLIIDVVKSKESKRFYAELIRVEDSLVKGKIALYFNSKQRELQAGDIITYQSTIKRIASPKNIGQFDYKRYMQGKEIYIQSYVNEYEEVGRVGSWKYEILHWRSSLINEIQTRSTYMSEEAKALMAALLLGEKSFIDTEVLSQFKDVGVMHVLAISGLHVGLIYFVLLQVFFFIPKRSQWVVILSILWVFVFLSGFSPSVFRAVFMFSIFTVCRLLRREQSLEHSIGVTLFFSLCFYPYWVYDIGFQLSYLAVISIVYFLPLFKNYYSENKILKYLQGIVYVSVSVQIGLIPLQLYYFHQFSFVFLLANLIVIPLVTILVVLGIAYLCTLWINGLSDGIAWIFSRFTEVLYYFVTVISDVDYLSFNQIKLSNYQLFLLVITIVFCTLSYYQKQFRYVIISICILIVFQIGSVFNSTNNIKTEYEIVIPYQPKGKLSIWIRENDIIHLMANEWDTLSRSTFDLENYKQEYAISRVVHQSISGVLPNKEKDILILNAFYSDYMISLKTPIILIAQQPKINFERMLENNQPELIVFHSSVPFWYKNKCIEVCIKKNIPFHDIYEKGYWSSL